MATRRVFVDTNVIIESFRVGCWTALCEHFAVETVDKCIEEAMTGDVADPRYVPVDSVIVNARLAARHPVAKLDIATLALEYPQAQGLDDGELHLLSYLHRHERPGNVDVLVSTADKAAIVVASLLGLLDVTVSLESLAEQSGLTRGQVGSLAGHYRTSWLDSAKVRIGLGMTP